MVFILSQKNQILQEIITFENKNFKNSNMSEFRIKVHLPDYPFKISHRDSVLCMGSCFAEHMYNRLAAFKFDTLLNPFGILYNPIIISKSLKNLLLNQNVTVDSLVFNQERWHSFQHHGHFSHPEKQQSLDLISESFENGRQFLQKTNRLIITLGTAYVYALNSSGEVVANCHKFPADHFKKSLLSVEDITRELTTSIALLNQHLPNLEILLAVSPVRHIRDGIIENQKSKSTLLLAVGQLCDTFKNVHYFPSYEIIMDELRDYRFYENDMVHPNDLAVEYIWSGFSDSFFEQATRKTLLQIKKIIQAASHRAFHPEIDSHQKFLKKQLEKISALEKQFPFLNFDKEIAIFKTDLND